MQFTPLSLLTAFRQSGQILADWTGLGVALVLRYHFTFSLYKTRYCWLLLNLLETADAHSDQRSFGASKALGKIDPLPVSIFTVASDCGP